MNFKFLTKELKINNGENIEEFVKKYHNDYNFLESNHGYIEWLFPEYTQGFNPQTHPLQLHELEVNCYNQCLNEYFDYFYFKLK